MQLIGVCGKAGSGKSTASQFLVKEYGYEEVSFASILKKMLALAGLPEPTNRDDKETIIEGLGFSWRHAAQTLGTEWGRACLGENIWIDLTMKSLDENGKYVFSDVRFQNESATIRKQGNMVHLKGREADLGECSDHPSENVLQTLTSDFVIYNTGSIESLHCSLDAMMRIYAE